MPEYALLLSQPENRLETLSPEKIPALISRYLASRATPIKPNTLPRPPNLPPLPPPRERGTRHPLHGPTTLCLPSAAPPPQSPGSPPPPATAPPTSPNAPPASPSARTRVSSSSKPTQSPAPSNQPPSTSSTRSPT